MTKFLIKAILVLLLFGSDLGPGIQAQGLQFSCPAGTVFVNDSTANDPALWTANDWLNNLIEGALPFTVLVNDSCTTGNTHFRFILQLDLDGNGQPETRVDSDSLPGRDSIHFQNMASGTVLGGFVRSFDDRLVANDLRYRFYLANDSVGPFMRRLQVHFISGSTTVPAELPYGTHQIQWSATNGCGATQTCAFSATLQDGLGPKVVCIPGFAVSLPFVPNSSVLLWASDFLEEVIDNNPATVQIGVRQMGQPDGLGNTTGFPRNANGSPQTGVSFNCGHLGPQNVGLWARDAFGREDSCVTIVTIQDNSGVCSEPPIIVSGEIKTAENKGLAEVEIMLGSGNNTGNLINTNVVSGAGGIYTLSNVTIIGDDPHIVPILDIDPLNGVTTWDFILISRHILGLEPFNSPYKLIAADANKSGTITTFDIVEFRKLLLGTYVQLPNNDSWRFVAQSQVFTNPNNPFADIIRESIPVAGSNNFNFVAVKIGDVDYSATIEQVGGTAETRFPQSASVAITGTNSGDQEEIWQFTPPAHLASYQFTLHLGDNTLLEMMPQGSLTNEHFALHERDGETVLTVACELGAQPFALRVRPGARAIPLRLSGDITPNVGYDRTGTPMDLWLQLPTRENAVVLHPNTPNPWRETTAIRFELPRAGAATLRFFDAMGRLVHASQTEGVKGINSYNLAENAAFLPGLYTFSLEFEGQFFVQKTIKF
jgi:hypothetical protein